MAKPPTSETKTPKRAAVEKPKKRTPAGAQQPAAPIAIPMASKAAKSTAAVKQPKANAVAITIPKSGRAQPSAATKTAIKPAESKPSSLRSLAADILNGTVVPTIDQIKALAAGFRAKKGKKAKDKKKKK